METDHPKRSVLRARSKPETGPELVLPYPASWLNHLIEWIDRQSGPPWAHYTAGVVLLALILAIGQVLTGGPLHLSRGSGAIIFAFYPVYFVALMHHLDRQASLALERFRPALEVGDAEYARIAYRLTTVPSGGAWLATALGIPLAAFFVMGAETLPVAVDRLPLLALGMVFTEFTVACFLIVVLHTVLQLRQVSELHRVATTINLLQPRPTYAFSRLTSRTAIGVVVFLYLDFVVNPPATGVALPYFAFVVAATVLMAAAFMLPLLSMHQRLAWEKARLESEVNQAVELAYRELRDQVQAKSLARVDELDKALSGLFRMREAVARLSTWPWQPETLRGMLAAVALPIFLWLIQFGLQKWLG
jgi:hypothetical protein